MGKGKKQPKQPKQAFHPSGSKTPRNVDPDYRAQTVLWSFAQFDYEHGWKDQGRNEDPFQRVGQYMRHVEGRTWAEIEADRKRDHSVSVADLCKEARDRLQKLKKNDIDSLWRFRFTGERRIWGIKQGRTLQVLWWDPNHRVCPSHKKHT